jgi:tubulin epsilon
LNVLIDHADCVFTFDNQALFDLCESINSKFAAKGRLETAVSQAGSFNSKRDSFTKMNTIIADVMLNLTASMRFEGSMNVDLNEVAMNLVPYPRLHFLLPSLSPLCQGKDIVAEEKR